MSLLLLPALALGFIASLIPFIYPVTLFNIPGVQLNLALGGVLANAVPASQGVLVGVAHGAYTLTLAGVFAVYGPPLMLVLLSLRRR